MDKLIVITGPTAAGKSNLAIALAKRFNGEVISADSRQIYKHLNIGSGKVTKKEMRGIPHHLLDVANPKHIFTASQYQKLAQAKIKEIWRRGKIPVVCGGAGLYIRAAIDGIIFPEVAPNLRLRTSLEKKRVEELFKILDKLDKNRAKNIDAKNPRRLIRAIEIATANGRVPQFASHPITANSNMLFIGLNPDEKILRQNIKARLLKRLKAKGKNNLIAEVKGLRKMGLSWRRLESLGLEYRYVARFLQNKLTRLQMRTELEQVIWRYAKRQLTWWRSDKRVKWLYNPKLYQAQAKSLCQKFLTLKPARS